MYVQYTAKDLLRKARAVALLKSVKAYPNGRFKYLDHVLIVDSEGWSALKIKLERTYKGSKLKRKYSRMNTCRKLIDCVVGLLLIHLLIWGLSWLGRS